jgi:hypothetical protein
VGDSPTRFFCAQEVSLLDGFQTVIGEHFDLFDFKILDGRFRRVNLPPLSAGHYWDAAELYANGTITVSAVPEPAATVTWLAACFSLGVLVRQRAWCMLRQ